MAAQQCVGWTCIICVYVKRFYILLYCVKIYSGEQAIGLASKTPGISYQSAWVQGLSLASSSLPAAVAQGMAEVVRSLHQSCGGWGECRVPNVRQILLLRKN